MRTRRQFRPSVEFMCVRIAPSTLGVNDPLAPGSTPPTTPVMDPGDFSTAPNVDDTNIQIIEPTPATMPTSTLC